MPAFEDAIYLDSAEEKMLQAIVQTAVALAAAGRPFVGEFRHYLISATCLRLNDHGVAQIEAKIVHPVGTAVQIRWELVPAARGGDVDSAWSSLSSSSACATATTCTSVFTATLCHACRSTLATARRAVEVDRDSGLAANEPNDHREGDRDNNAGRDRSVEDDVPRFNANVSREVSKAESDLRVP